MMKKNSSHIFSQKQESKSSTEQKKNKIRFIRRIKIRFIMRIKIKTNNSTTQPLGVRGSGAFQDFHEIMGASPFVVPTFFGFCPVSPWVTGSI